MILAFIGPHTSMTQTLTPPTSTPVLRARQLTCRFGRVTAVDRLDLDIPRGSLYGMLGPNGAGKSTSMKLFVGMQAPTSGSVEVFGLDLKEHATAIKRRTGVVPENLALFDRLTGPEYLYFAGRLHAIPLPELRRRIDELLTLMELTAHPQMLVGAYSHGMQKKLALAAALIHAPELLILDEPFEGVDPVASHMLKELMRQAVARGLTLVLTSHVLEVVEKLCSHAAIIHQGRVVASGPLKDLRRLEDHQSASLETIFMELVGAEMGSSEHLSWLKGTPLPERS